MLKLGGGKNGDQVIYDFMDRVNLQAMEDIK